MPPATTFTAALVQKDALQKAESQAHKGLTETSPTRCPCKCPAVTQLLRDSQTLFPLHFQSCPTEPASLAPRAPDCRCLGICACIDPTATTVSQNYWVSKLPLNPPCSTQLCFCLLWQPALLPRWGLPTQSILPALGWTLDRGRPVPPWALTSCRHQQLRHDKAVPASTELPRQPLFNFMFLLLHAVKLLS